jgi:hypothetical protein
VRSQQRDDGSHRAVGGREAAESTPSST